MENGIVSPIGYRIFTPDDWIVRIEYADGTVLRKGVAGDVEQDEAVHVALRTCRLFEKPKSIDVRRRRDWNTVQA
jgi:hypothetical protein